MLISWALHRSRDATMHVGKLVASRLRKLMRRIWKLPQTPNCWRPGADPARRLKRVNGVCASMSRDGSLNYCVEIGHARRRRCHCTPDDGRYTVRGILNTKYVVQAMK